MSSPRCGVFVVAAAALLAPPVHAQASSGAAAAQELFDQAKALMAQNKLAEACPKFEESQRLDPGSGTLLNLGRCYEVTGRFASAWSTYLEAAALAKTSGNLDRETRARDLAAALAPRLSRLVVDVAADARVPGLEVKRDGLVVGAPQWGVPIPTDGGQHAIVARAPGYVEWTGTVAVTEEGKTTTVVVPLLRPVEAPPPAAESAPSPGLGGQRIAALAVGGVGVVGVAIGTVFGLKAKSRLDEARTHCDGTTCRDDRGVTAGNDAHAAGNVATVFMVAGAVGVAAGLTLWFTAPSSSEAPRVGMAVGPGTLDVRGSW